MLGSEASSSGPAQVSTWVVSPSNSGVSAIAVSGSTAYVGGFFDYIGPETGSFASLDPATGAVAAPWPIVDGEVYAAAGDGTGGFFVGGQFQLPGSNAMRQLAHIRADGTVDPDFQPPSGSGIDRALAVSDTTIYTSGPTVYLGGVFNLLGSSTVSLGAVNATDGAPTGWHPSPRFRNVRDIVVFGSTVYVAGSSLEAYDAVSGQPTGFAPVAGGFANALAVSGGRLGVGGEFRTIGADTGPVPPPVRRENLAAIDLTTGRPTAWAPEVNEGVSTLAISGSTIYAGGTFLFANNTRRDRLAAFDLATGALMPWDPGVHDQGSVSALSLVGSTVYVGGRFTSVGDPAVTRNNLAAF